MASKAEWDFLQRLRLLLLSDGEVRHGVRHSMTPRQYAALACLAGLSFALYAGSSYWLVAPSLTLASLVIGRLGARAARARQAEPLTPFGSLAELRRVRRSIPTFAKVRFPCYLARRRLRHPVIYAIMLLPTIILSVSFSPLVLLYQAVPEADEVVSVVLPSSG